MNLALAAVEPVAPEHPAFPEFYGMTINLNGVVVDGFEDGCVALMTTREEPRMGDLVCAHTRHGGAVMLVLEADLGPEVFSRMPWVKRPGDGLEPLVVGTVFGSAQRLCLRMGALLAVHKCTGRHDA